MLTRAAHTSRLGASTHGQSRGKPQVSTGDRMLRIVSGAAGLVAVAVLADVVYQIVHGASPALSHLGLGFITRSAWAPYRGVYGAAAAIFGTVVSAVVALVLATPLGIAIGLYLGLMAPPGVRALIGPLVEMLAAIPSVIVGFWGVIVLAPFVSGSLEPALHDTLGFIPLFGSAQTTGLGVFTAGLVLTLMILPIVAALSRDLFLTVPPELRDGAAALGATRWEIIRGVVLPSTASGVAAAAVLGLGRALGEAIAVTQTIGDGAGIHGSLFLPGISISSRIATEFQSGSQGALDYPSLFYIALVLLVIGMATSLLARAIAGRFDVQQRLVA
jgi:phosphate transport system permease protein